MSAAPVQLDRSIPLGALFTSFVITLHGLLQWKRILLLLFLSIVPLAGVFIFRTIAAPRLQGPIAYHFLQFEFFSVLAYFSAVVAPITTLLLATGMIRDEQENQTLTYLMLCPIPRWALYLSKLLAAMLVAWIMTMVCMGLIMFCLWTGSGVENANDWLSRWLALLPTFALLIAAHAGVFGLISVLVRPSLIIGVIYIALWEGFLANFPFVLRKFTCIHYFQCMVCNWIGDQYKITDGRTTRYAIEWAVAREILPETQECVIVLLSIFLASTLLAMYVFTTREFRMKTPEGN